MGGGSSEEPAVLTGGCWVLLFAATLTQGTCNGSLV